MDVKVQNCSAGVFVLNYPRSMGCEALGDCYCLAKEQLGDNVLVPVEEGCSLNMIGNIGEQDDSVYVLRFPLNVHDDFEKTEKIYTSVMNALGDQRTLIGIPDNYSITKVSLEQLNSIRDNFNQYVDWVNQRVSKNAGGANG